MKWLSNHILVLLLALCFSPLCHAHDLDDDEFCDDDEDSLTATFVLLGLVALTYAAIGDIPGDDFSFGRYPYAVHDYYAETLSEEARNSRPFTGDEEKHYWFSRSRLDAVHSLSEARTGYSLFTKLESSYTPGFSFWHQQLFEQSGSKNSTLTSAVIDSRVATEDYVRIFWTFGGSYADNIERGNDAAGILGAGVEVWPAKPLFFEGRYAAHLDNITVNDIYLGTSWQFHKCLSASVGYRGLYTEEGKATHLITAGVSIAFGFW